MVICQNLDVVQIWYPFLHAVSYEVPIQLEVISSLESVLTSSRLHLLLFFPIEGVEVEAGVASGTVGKLPHWPS